MHKLSKLKEEQEAMSMKAHEENICKIKELEQKQIETEPRVKELEQKLVETRRKNNRKGNTIESAKGRIRASKSPAKLAPGSKRGTGS